MNKELSLEEQNILDKFYIEMEKIVECIPLIQPDISDWSKVSSELQLKICIESNSLSILDHDNIRQIFNDRIDDVVVYLKERIQNTQNNLLKAKYNHLLYCLTRNNQYGKKAIDEYQRNLALFLNNQNLEILNTSFQDVFDIIIRLTETTKYKAEELKIQIHNYLNDPKIHARIKTCIIGSISKATLFKVRELDYLPELCINLSKNEIEHRFVEMNLRLGLEIAIRLQNIDKQREINELLGDNEYKNLMPYDGNFENIIIPHNNSIRFIKIIQYYKNANNVKKRDNAILDYIANKKNCKLLKIKSTVKSRNGAELQRMVAELFFSIVNSSTRQIIYQLIFGDNLFFIPDVYLDKNVDENKNNIIYQLFNPVWIDLNNNKRNVEVKDHLRFQMYSISLSKTIDFTSDIIFTSFVNKKLSYNKVARVLSRNEFFGQELIITRNDQDLSYTWFEMIDIGLKSFFEQYYFLLKNKQPDWRFSIDFLSLKFEGIFRDIVGLAGGIITKIDDKGDTKDLLLDDLLRSDFINKIFNKDDLNLFQYTFTNKGYNIRNNVAHSFYKPKDYTMHNAILVLLCVLRLAKFNLMEMQKQKPIDKKKRGESKN